MRFPWKWSWFPERRLALVAALAVVLSCSGNGQAPPHRVYAHLLAPREHPDYARRAVQPPDWGTFEGQPQFTCLRGFAVKDGRLVGFEAELDKFTRQHELGRVIWPSYPVLFAENLDELAAAIQRRGLYLFDIWGYVPGSGPGGYWQQFKPPPEVFPLLERQLGERWLGTDLGEQDGRYVGGYAGQMIPASADRFAQYLNFQRHFERMSDDLGHRHAVLVSLNFGHYLLKEGTCTLLGAETAQALPNSQVYYAFIRGAGKQYGVPWFGNASIYNRWGWKHYASSGRNGYAFGPTKGTSLSLLKRLLYSHLLYNAVAVGFENGWFVGDDLSPIGRIQEAAQRWVKCHGPPGVQLTPVALLLDFYAGWSFPRHLYSGDVYRVWGNLPYAEGDYLTDAVLDLIYPGYEAASWFHDERGFLSPTPFGDVADCLLSDAPGWLLARFPVVIAAGALRGGRELGDKLRAYTAQGGHLVLTRANLTVLQTAFPEVAASDLAAAEVRELPLGRGRLTVFGSPFGLEPVPDAPVPRSQVDQPLPRLRRLRPEVRAKLAAILAGQRLFDVGNTNLAWITCRRRAGEYTVGLFNNTWRPQPFAIRSECGPLIAVEELALDTSERTAVGLTPEGVDPAGLGTNAPGQLAGGDLRIFTVRVRESGVQEIPHRVPPARPRGRLLPLRGHRPIKEAILARPTFFEHFSGVVVDWRYFAEREPSALAAEAGWIQRQGLDVFADLSSGVNLYPTLRLVDNVTADYTASLNTISNVLVKMERVSARHLILPLHRQPENNFTTAQTRASFEATLGQLASWAAARHVTLHLRLAPHRWPGTPTEAARLLERIGAPNLRLAVSTAWPGGPPPSRQAAAAWLPYLGLWLVAGSQTDVAGRRWDLHTPIHQMTHPEEAAGWVELAPDVPRVLDAVYAGPDEEYLDAVTMAATFPRR